ncbi:hypothetical protein [Virgibacillus pantothenticus]|uniref:hypothetical protein n=1 Tax=Virgibacillus pantothenticus TaxID=1473 RepID=UPI00098587C8|nr:hypothetical protein [Virgibacillus pantothenticus]
MQHQIANFFVNYNLLATAKYRRNLTQVEVLAMKNEILSSKLDKLISSKVQSPKDKNQKRIFFA